MVTSPNYSAAPAGPDKTGIVLPIRAQRSGAGSRADHQAGGPGPVGDTPAQARSVGRELPLARLLDNLKSALSGTGRTCLIAGEAGIGKTRLLQELLDRAQAYDCLVLSGKAQDYDH